MKMSQVEIGIWSSERVLLAKDYLMIVQNNFTPGIWISNISLKRGFFSGDENILELDSGDGHTTLWIY